MKNLRWMMLLTFLLAACAPADQPKQEPAATAGPTPKPYGNLAQVMRTLPFPQSNIIFDTQSNDPDVKQKEAQKSSAGGGGGAVGQYGALYGGWEGVEAAAVALSETANLILIPGRKCMNGKDVPLDQENFKKWAQGLVDAGLAAQKAAKTKNMDMMVEVSGTVSDACLACHEVYRDQPGGKERCTP